MSDLHATARRAGALYLVFGLVAAASEFLFPRFVVIGDAAATAKRIVESQTVYRLGIVTALVTHVLFLLVVLSLYTLFRDVSRPLARLMVLFVTVGVAMALANLINKVAPLVLLNGGDYLTVFTRPQLEALVLAFLRIHSGVASIVIVFWGLWLLPFGTLVMKSRFLPRWLGVLLWVAGVGYIITSLVATVTPEYRSLVTRFVMPMYFGELPIIFWLLIKGAPAAARVEQTAA